MDENEELRELVSQAQSHPDRTMGITLHRDRCQKDKGGAIAKIEYHCVFDSIA